MNYISINHELLIINNFLNNSSTADNYLEIINSPEEINFFIINAREVINFLIINYLLIINYNSL